MSAQPQPVPAPLPALKYAASLQPGKPHELPAAFVGSIQRLQAALQMPVWFLIQPGGTPGEFRDLDYATKLAMCAAVSVLPEGEKIALLVDSPGGDAKCAYQIADLLESGVEDLLE